MIIYVLILLLSFILDAKTLAPFRKLNVPRNTALNHLHSFQHLRVGSISSAPPKDSVFFATVSTIVGSKLFDKTKRFSLPANSTVKDVKDLIKLSFPGDIPCSMQSLYFGSKQLLDDDIVAELSPGVSTVPLLLDTLSIVSPPPISAGGDLSMTLSQSIDTCVALYVYQLYINSKLLLAISPGQIQDTSSDEEENEDSEDTLTDSEKYGSLLAIINHTIHERFSGEIARAREEEKDPEVYSEETVRWRGRWAATSMDAQKTTETLASDQQRVWDVLIPKRVLQAVMPWFAHHFDCNADTFREYTIYSLLLWVCFQCVSIYLFTLLTSVCLCFSIIRSMKRFLPFRWRRCCWCLAYLRCGYPVCVWYASGPRYLWVVVYVPCGLCIICVTCKSKTSNGCVLYMLYVL